MRRYMTSKIVAFLLVLPWILPAYADKWLPPKPATYESRRGTYRLTVFPAHPMPDETELSKGVGDARSHTNARCEAVLERIDNGGRQYEQVWRKPLTNVVAPVSALVSDADGSFVTFDNWGRMGWGDDVIVLYSASGVVRKKFALTDIMNDSDFKKLPRTASSVHWRGQHELDYDGRTLSVRIVAVDGISLGDQDDGYVEQEGEFRTVRIDVNSGRILEGTSRGH